MRSISYSLLAIFAFLAKYISGAEKNLPFPGEVFSVLEHTAFLILPDAKLVRDKQMPWVWYAPTLRGLPGRGREVDVRALPEGGIAIAGIDVGESYGSQQGRDAYTALHNHLVEKRGLAKQASLLARSRGGLMLYSWTTRFHKASITGIYPVCNIVSYPGLKRACGAYGLMEEQLKTDLAKHNPIDRLESLAEAKVPIFHIHMT